MPNISLAEAVKLKSVLSKRIHELEEEMDRTAFVEIEKGTQPPKQSRTLAQVESDLAAIRKDFRLLDVLMYKANSINEIEFEGNHYTIVEAIELAAQLRAQARKYKVYGSVHKEEFLYAVGDSSAMHRVATFEPEEYRLKALETERQANRLSNAINAKNYSILLDFNGDQYF
ncbi:MAG: hypothetical protein AB2374_13855 [Cytobacillus gottheilii]|uniref:hypothetical protein n=1 Tax=Cytobacillus gottheilii TaxID=859144 RepID=UPI00082F47AB|nr:hypothetical protein [Cytobacillus gottheilii]